MICIETPVQRAFGKFASAVGGKSAFAPLEAGICQALVERLDVSIRHEVLEPHTAAGILNGLLAAGARHLRSAQVAAFVWSTPFSLRGHRRYRNGIYCGRLGASTNGISVTSSPALSRRKKVLSRATTSTISNSSS
jgi:hypothetical protein